RARAAVVLLAYCLAPGSLIAQGVGRLGNWWNQELFGKPTDLPWGLEIDAPPFPDPPGTTYHTTDLHCVLVSAGQDFPPVVPLRADLGSGDGGGSRLRDRAGVPAAPAGNLRRVHRA